jgi:hypothetical protein
VASTAECFTLVVHRRTEAGGPTVLDTAKLEQIVRSWVAELHEGVYASAGDAFAHVAVREYFDLDDEEALEYCDVGGSRDKGIDAFWFDERSGGRFLCRRSGRRSQSRSVAPSCGRRSPRTDGCND